MAEPFVALVDELLAGPMGISATYRAGGVGHGQTVRVLIGELTAPLDYETSRIGTHTLRLEARKTDLAKPERGDTVQIGDDVWVVSDAPVEDALGLLWRLDCYRWVS